MKVLVAYFSQTGNTKKVAEAIFHEIQAEKEVRELSKIDDLKGYDLAFVGFPIQNFGPPKKAKDFLEKHSGSRKVALFITHSAPEGSKALQGWLAKCKEAASEANLLGVFDCQGELAQNVRNAMLRSGDPNLRAWAERDTSKGQPDATRLERARVFAREIMGKIK